jgi:hypothetical protein
MKAVFTVNPSDDSVRIHCSEIPSSSERDGLKAHGFKFIPMGPHWQTANSQSALAYARSVALELTPEEFEAAQASYRDKRRGSKVPNASAAWTRRMRNEHAETFEKYGLDADQEVEVLNGSQRDRIKLMCESRFYELPDDLALLAESYLLGRTEANQVIWAAHDTFRGVNAKPAAFNIEPRISYWPKNRRQELLEEISIAGFGSVSELTSEMDGFRSATAKQMRLAMTYIAGERWDTPADVADLVLEGCLTVKEVSRFIDAAKATKNEHGKKPLRFNRSTLKASRPSSK